MASLVTGASGFIGSRLVEKLRAEGERVIAVGRTIGNDPDGLVADVRSFDDWKAALADVDTVYHLAWTTLPATASADPPGDALANVVASLRMFEGLADRTGTRIVFTSSGGTVYGRAERLPIDEEHPTRPISAYGVSKLAVEQYLHFYHVTRGLRPIVLRISNVYGPGQAFGRQFGAIATFAANFLKDQPITIFGDGSTIRDYVYIDDVVEALIAAARSPLAAGIMNIGLGEGRSLRQIVDILSSIVETSSTISYETHRAIDVPACVLDIGLARRLLGWAPRLGFDEGVARTVAFMRTVLQ